MNNRGVYIKLFDEETPIFISMTQVELQWFISYIHDFSSSNSKLLSVKTQETDKYYNFKNIKEITIQGELF